MAEAKAEGANYALLLTRCESVLREVVKLHDELATLDGTLRRGVFWKRRDWSTTYRCYGT